MGCLAALAFLVLGYFIGGPVGGIIGLLFAIAVGVLSRKKS